jgi:hypothetical protein
MVDPGTVLNLLLGSVAVAGLTVFVVEVERAVLGRTVEVAVEVRAAGAVAEVNLPTGLLVEVVVGVREAVVADFLSAVGPATLDRRSIEEEVGLRGARVDVVPAMDMRFAELEIPRFSSPELATDRGFSSAELLTDIRDRWDEVVEVPNGLRVAGVVVVVGRVGGLFRVPLEPVVGFDADDDVGRLVAAVPDTGRLTAPGALGLTLAGEALEASLTTSGLDFTTSSPPESTEDSIGVTGGSFSSTSTGTSAGAGAMTGSSTDDMSGDCSKLMY